MYKYLPIIICFLVSTISSAQSFTKNESVGLTLSLPFVNRYTFYEYSENRSTSKTGIIGAGSSIFYKHNRIKYSLNWANSIDINFNSFAKGDGSDNIEVNLLEGLVHYCVYKKLNFIGGINYSKYHYTADYSMLDTLGLYSNAINKNDRSIGLTLGTEIACTNHISIVAFYRPSLYCFDKKSFKQMFSLDFRFDINLWKMK